MELLRVFNNNVVLARNDAGVEVILTGRGLGFQARPGQPVDATKVVRVFEPSDGRDPDHLGELFTDIPEEHLDVVTTAMEEAGFSASQLSRPSLVIALADHIGFALKRAQSGMDIEYPLTAEIETLYAQEAAQARTLVAAINRRLPQPLPDGEEVAVALHLVNAGFSTGDLSWTYTMTGIIQQMLAIISQTYSIDLDPSSVSVARFITHLRYLFVRIAQHKQLEQEPSDIGTVIRTTYPEAYQCAQHLATIIGLRLECSLSSDEVSYLTLHVARAVQEATAE